MKWAESQDGFMAPEDSLHNKKRWETNEETKSLVHSWRSQEDAIMVGKNTVLKDNPSLTARDYFGKNPLRIILGFDKTFESKTLLTDGIKTIIFNSSIENTVENIEYIKETNPSSILDILWKKKVQSLFVEGGKHVLESFIHAGYYDEIRILKGNVYLKSGIPAPKVPTNIKWRTTKYYNDKLLIGTIDS